MKRSLLLITFCAGILHGAFAQTKKTAPSTIDKVTVFIKGAQVDRKAPVYLAPGSYEIEIPDLTATLNPATLQTKGSANIDILAVRTGRSFSDIVANTQYEDSLHTAVESLQNDITILQATLKVLQEERDLLLANKELPLEGAGSWATQLAETADFYRKRMKEISLEGIRLSQEIRQKEKALTLSQKRLMERPDEEPEEKMALYLEVKVKRQVRDTLHLSYQVADARWFPEYDFRISDLNSPLNIQYKALISQQTGEDWKDVKLVVNTGSPGEASQAPQASTWWLRPNLRSQLYGSRSSYSPTTSAGFFDGTVQGRVVSDVGEPVPGTSVIIPNTTIGTVTDIDGRYSLRVPEGYNQLQYSFVGMETVTQAINGSQINVVMTDDDVQLEEVVVTGLSGKVAGVNMHATTRGPIRIRGTRSKQGDSMKAYDQITSLLDNSMLTPAPKEFVVDAAFSLASDPKPKQIPLESYDVSAEYSYFALPRKDQRAYLQASITNWQQLNMLDGTANLFLENTYLGRIPFMKDQLSDTLEIDLGPDPKVQVSFEKVKDLSGSQFLGNKKKETQVHAIKVRNNRAYEVAIEVVDLIPVPSMDNVHVDRIGEGGTYKEEEGIIKWRLTLSPGESEAMRTGFEVKYPSHINLTL